MLGGLKLIENKTIVFNVIYLEMRTFSILIIAAVCIYGCLRREAKLQNTNQNNLLVFGTVDSLFSEHINEYRKFWIYLPSPANDPTHKAIKYPVLYLK